MEEYLDLQDLNPVEMLIKIGKHYGKSAVFTSSLGLEDMVITDMIARNNIDVEIATIDTGRLPDETYQLMETVRSEMGIEGLIKWDWVTRLAENFPMEKLMFEAPVERQQVRIPDHDLPLQLFHPG